MFPDIEPDFVPVEKRWRREKIPGGTCCKGFKVGPLVMAWVHWADPNSKPCRHEMTCGKLSCPCTETKIAKRKLGYLPLQTIHGENIVVTVSNSVAAIIKPLPQGAPIELNRSLKPCTPLRYNVWPDYECGAEKRKRVAKYQPANIQPWLLHLWGDMVLMKFFADQVEALVDVTPPPATHMAPWKKPTKEEFVKQVIGIDPEKLPDPVRE